MDINPNAQSRDLGSLNLVNTWCFWEKYQSTEKKNKSNFDNGTKLCTIKTLDQFAVIFKDSTYKKISSLFYDSYRSKEKKIKIDDSLVGIDGIFMFKEGISPKWEDSANAHGGHLFIDLKNFKTFEIDHLWKNLTFSLVGNTLSHCKNINGFRLLDRIKKHGSIKFEVWLNISTHYGDQKEITKNHKIIEDITDGLLKILNKVVANSNKIFQEPEFSWKEHMVAIKS